MVKIKTAWFCQSCGYESPKWQGKCPTCNQWNSFVEEVIHKESKTSFSSSSGKHENPKPKLLENINPESKPTLLTQDFELNRVLGNGIVAGSVVLMGGEPGIGKSTLMLQLGANLPDKKILYVTGEESDLQIKLRAERLDFNSSNFYVLTETNTHNILSQTKTLLPDVVIIDSIQTVTSPLIDSTAGSVSQIRECTSDFIKYAKETGTPFFLIGHITKEGSLAGPKLLEHMVDTVLHFEGDRHLSYRILRTTKNRFGSTSELGIYEMQGSGLRQVSNPSEILLSQREGEISGVATAATLEGNRSLLIEVQALVSPATYGTPQRTATGYDNKRLNMLLAVLEKRNGFRLSSQDVFLNIAGGIKVEDPSIDLAVCLSIVSSLEEIPISSKSCFSGEVGLGGEVRAVNKIDLRLSEAEKLGFKEIYISKYNKINPSNYKIKVHQVTRLDEVFTGVFG